MPASALLFVLFVIAVTVVLFSLLPAVRVPPADRPPAAGPQALPVPPPAPPAEVAIPPVTVPPAVPEPVPPVIPEAPLLPEPPPPEPPAQAALPPQPVPPETRERGIYLVRIEDDGAVLHLARVARNLGDSGSPLTDTLNALLAGPTPEEAALGFVSFIPPDVRLISARVELGTAFVNFNEDFRYNTRGSEGFTQQVRQVVWTATEFPNVGEVQILIGGSRVEFLHHGVGIGSPISRQP